MYRSSIICSLLIILCNSEAKILRLKNLDFKSNGVPVNFEASNDVKIEDGDNKAGSSVNMKENDNSRNRNDNQIYVEVRTEKDDASSKNNAQPPKTTKNTTVNTDKRNSVNTYKNTSANTDKINTSVNTDKSTTVNTETTTTEMETEAPLHLKNGETLDIESLVTNVTSRVMRRFEEMLGLKKAPALREDLSPHVPISEDIFPQYVPREEKQEFVLFRDSLAL